MEREVPLDHVYEHCSRRDILELSSEALCVPKTSPLLVVKQPTSVSSAVVPVSKSRLFRLPRWPKHTRTDLDIERDLHQEPQSIQQHAFAEPSVANPNLARSLTEQNSASSISETDSSSVSTIFTLKTSDSSPLTRQTSLDHTFTSNLTIVQGFMVDSLSTDDKLVQVWKKQIESRLRSAILSHVDSGGFAIEFVLVGTKQSNLKHTITVSCVGKKTKRQIEELYGSLHWLRAILKEHRIRFMTFHANTTLIAAHQIPSTKIKPKFELKFSANSTTYCGAALCTYHGEETNLIASAVGGMILVDNTPYLLTVGHALASNSDSVRDVIDENDDNDDNDENDDSSMAVAAPCIFDEDDTLLLMPEASQNSVSISGMNYYEEHDAGTVGVSHLHACDAPHLFVDLLKIDDIKIEPVECDYSSNFKGIDSETEVVSQKDMDWMLLSIASNNILPNRDQFGRYIDDVIDVPGEAKAVVIINPSGTTEDTRLWGTLHPIPVFLSLFSNSYEVYRITTDFIWKPGTSGLWVVLDGKVCGQIIAGRQDVPWVYMISMQAIFDNIQAELQASCVRILPREFVHQSLLNSEEGFGTSRLVFEDAMQVSEAMVGTGGSSLSFDLYKNEHQHDALNHDARTEETETEQLIFAPEQLRVPIPVVDEADQNASHGEMAGSTWSKAKQTYTQIRFVMMITWWTVWSYICRSGKTRWAAKLRDWRTIDFDSSSPEGSGCEVEESHFNGPPFLQSMENENRIHRKQRKSLESILLKDRRLPFSVCHNSDEPNWRPFSMRLPWMMILILIAFGLAGLQEYLCQQSLKSQKSSPPTANFAFTSVDGVSNGQVFVWRYLPTLVVIIYSILVSLTDWDIRRLEPYYQLSQPLGARASTSLNFDYVAKSTPVVLFQAVRLRQWTVFASTFAYITAAVIAPALQLATFDVQIDGKTNCTTASCPETVANGTQFRIVMHPTSSRLLTTSYIIVGLFSIFIAFRLRRKSGLLRDPKGIAGIAAMATRSEVLKDFERFNPTRREDIHERIAHRKFFLRQSKLCQGEWFGETETDCRRRLTSRHPTILSLRTGLPCIAISIAWLIGVFVTYLTPARFILNQLQWLPVLLATGLKLVWSNLEANVRLIEPFYRLSKGSCKPENSLTLDYKSTPYGWTPVRAALNGHFLVSIVGLCSILLDILTINIGFLSMESSIFRERLLSQHETYISFWTCLSLSIGILIFTITTASIVYLRRHRPILPYQPNTIASVLSYIYCSKMLNDFANMHSSSNKGMEKELKMIGKRYSIGWYRKRDGELHYSIDEQPSYTEYIPPMEMS